MDLIDIAKDINNICQSLLEGRIDDKTFRTSIMSMAFIASGVSDEEMKVFNSILESIYQMKKIGRNEVLDVFKNVSGNPKDITKILEKEPIRQIPRNNTKGRKNGDSVS